MSSLESDLHELNSSQSRNSSTCLVGDFNAKNSVWWNGQTTDEAGAKLADLMADFGLFQIVDGPTRTAGTQQASQLDLMFIDKISLVDSCQVLSPLADHRPTLMKSNFLAQPIPRRQETSRNLTDTPVSELNLAFHSTSSALGEFANGP